MGQVVAVATEGLALALAGAAGPVVEVALRQQEAHTGQLQDIYPASSGNPACR